MTRAQRMFAEALIVVGVLGALWVAVGRTMVEQTNRTVALAVDWQEVRALAAAEGVGPIDVLTVLHSAGATHLAIPELALGDLVDRGEVALFSQGSTVEVWADDPGTLLQVARGLQSRFPGTYQRTEMGEEEEQWLTVPASAVDDPAVGAGYPRAAVEAAGQAGMEIVVRPRWQGVRTANAADQVVQAGADIGASMVVFAGDQVVGFPGNVDATAAAMQRLGLTFGMIELAPQLGAGELATRLDHRLVRVHSITDAEMRLMSADRAAERFVRAAREREVRLLYLRLLPSPPGGLLAGNAEYISRVRGELRAHGMRTASSAPGQRVEPLAPFWTPAWALIVVQIGVCAGALWLVQAFFALRARWFWALAALLILSAVARMLLMPDIGRTMGALGAAVIFPIISVCYVARAAVSMGTARPRLGSALWPVLGGFLAASAVTAIGGLLIVGLLGDSAYLTKVAQFRGVKIAQVVPLLAIALIWLARSTDAYRNRLANAGPDMVDYHTGDTAPEWPALWAGLREALRGLVVYWHVAAAFVGLSVLAVLVVRSGNEAGGAILPGELELRALLDKLLLVRPRTKEVFLGHPVMLLALLLALRRVRPGVWIAFAIGAIGQVSLLNSFCHVHTPLLLTLIRVFNGLWVGGLGGVVLCVLWDAFGGAPPAEQQAVPPEDAGDDEP